MMDCLRALAVTTLFPLLAGCGTSAHATDEGPHPAAAPHAGRAAVAAKPAQPESAPNQIVIDNFTFQPARLTVKAGTRVTWVNRDDLPHSATSSVRPRLFDSGTLDTDEQFSHVFTAPGSYDYFCTLHPRMTGQILVK